MELTPESEKVLERLKKMWVGEYVEIIGKDHPHKGERGLIESIDYTQLGWAWKVSLEDSVSCYVFKKQDFKTLNK